MKTQEHLQTNIELIQLCKSKQRAMEVLIKSIITHTPSVDTRLLDAYMKQLATAHEGIMYVLTKHNKA
jgi:hypothetical protein